MGCLFLLLSKAGKCFLKRAKTNSQFKSFSYTIKKSQNIWDFLINIFTFLFFFGII